MLLVETKAFLRELQWLLPLEEDFADFEKIKLRMSEFETKSFQDQKGSGFKIESLKITSYSRFKRLLFLIYVAQAILHIELISANCRVVRGWGWNSKMKIKNIFSKNAICESLIRWSNQDSHNDYSHN